MMYWVGVKNRPPQTVFEENDEQKICKENYPQYSYVMGPYESKELAERDASNHVNIDGTFTDPFCNDGKGR